MISRLVAISTIVLALSAALVLPKINTQVPFLKLSEKVKAQKVVNANPYPIQKKTYLQPAEISAKSAVVIDAKSGSILFEKNPNLKHLPASTTKLMTALITLKNCSPTQIVTISQVEKAGTQMGLKIGDQISVENLLYGLLINSGNDAAFALANTCSNSSNNFVSEMNVKAKELEMENTHFTNPAGFDDNFQYSTAVDLAKLANIVMSDPLIHKIVATKSTVVTDTSALRTYYLKNVNELLGEVAGIEGIKTGQTEGAQENLITRTTRNGNSAVVVILGSEDRFTESKNLIEWVFNSYDWVNP